MRRVIAAGAMTAMLCAFAPLLAAEEKSIDLAAIITKADAHSALGEAVKDPQSRNGEGADGYYSRCNYYSENPGKSLVLRVRQAGPGQLEPNKQFEEMSAANQKLKPISGLGDKAAAVREGAEKGPSHGLMLYGVKGDYFITIGISGVDDEKGATEKATTLARKIVKHF